MLHRAEGTATPVPPHHACVCICCLPLAWKGDFGPAQFGDGWQWGELRVLSSLSGSLSKVSESL